MKIIEIHTLALKCKEKWFVPEGFPQELSYGWVWRAEHMVEIDNRTEHVVGRGDGEGEEARR